MTNRGDRIVGSREIRGALERAGLLVAVAGALPDRLTGIADDSRAIGRGELFVAVKGTDRDGHDYVTAATTSGASAVIVEREARRGILPAFVVRDGRRAAAVAAVAFYGNPGADLQLIGVTGTNGKTTTVSMIRHLVDGGEGGRAASLGTLGVLVGSSGEEFNGGGGLTTPGPVELQRVLRALADRGVRRVAMEVSSHSLAQRRVDGLRFAAAVFTNLTRDHLDYHGTMEDYFAAKASLVGCLTDDGAAVVNADDPAWGALPQAPRRITFGVTMAAQVRATGMEYYPDGSNWRLATPASSAQVKLPLIGDFNVVNAVGAAAAAFALGHPAAEIAARLATLPQVPGRLERIGEHPIVLRDYAHTPDALERALTALRPFVRGQLIVVFGAGGDRDKGKRPIMGRVAAGLADRIVVTSDNPRTEDPERIIDEIVSGLSAERYERIEDRRAAIARAIDLADPSRDCILLAGKGHETYQVRGSDRLPFDEKAITRELLDARAGAGR